MLWSSSLVVVVIVVVVLDSTGQTSVIAIITIMIIGTTRGRVALRRVVFCLRVCAAERRADVAATCAKTRARRDLRHEM